MELRFVVPNMEKTFGNLEFAGENTTEQQRINGRMAVITRSYNLYSDVQRADDVVVVLPAKAGEKHFSPEQKVKLINPRITTDGYKIGERGFVNYIPVSYTHLDVYKRQALYAQPRTFCRTVRRVALAGEVKHQRCGACLLYTSRCV